MADDYLSLNQNGMQYLELGEYDTAMEKFNQAVQINPNLSVAYNNLGKAYVAQNKQDKALESFNKALGLNSDFIPALWERGKLYTRTEKWEQALADYNKLLELDSESTSAYHNRGRVYVKLEEFEKAIVDYNHALKLDASLTVVSKDIQIARAEIQNREGKKYFSQGDYRSAKKHFKQALEFDPQFARAYNNLGLVQLHLAGMPIPIVKYEFERREEHLTIAIKYFDKARLLDPDMDDAYSNRGTARRLLKGKETTDEILADYHKALELNPNNIEALINLGVFYSHIGLNDKALTVYSQALELEPIAAVHCFKGSIYSKIGEYDKAIVEYNKSLELDSIAETYNARGETYIRMGKINEAEEDLKSALKSLEAGALLGLSKTKAGSRINFPNFQVPRFKGYENYYTMKFRETIHKNMKKANVLMRKQTGQNLWNHILQSVQSCMSTFSKNSL